jgi:predicted amidohydrolase
MAIKIACLQYSVINANILANEEIYLRKINDLKGQNIDFIVLPEMCFSGFDYVNLKEHSNKTTFIMKKIASFIDDNTFVFVSLPENIDGKIFNTVFIISSQGVTGKYSKNMLFTTVNEHIYFASSKQVNTFYLNGINITTFLCYEIRFPELIRMVTYNNDIQIIIIPAIWPHSKIDHWITLLKARAIENHCFVVGCNASYVVSKNKHIDCGTSIIIDPWGKIMSRIEKDNTLTVELNMDLVEKAKELVPSLEQAKNYFNITFL